MTPSAMMASRDGGRKGGDLVFFEHKIFAKMVKFCRQVVVMAEHHSE